MEPRNTLPPRLVHAALLVLGALALASLYHRSCFIDDAWLGERAFWLARDGFVHSELFRGQAGYGERMFVFHKLFALCGAAFVRVLGWSLYVLKSVSLLFFVVFLALLWRYGRRFASGEVAALTALLLLAHGLVGLHLFVYRPEIMLMALGFGAFLLMREFLESGRRLPLVGSAVLAGLCVLTHLNGLVFLSAGTVLLLSRRRPGAAALFAVVSTAVGSLYLVDALVAGKLPTLVHQLRGDPILAQRFADASSRLSGALREHERYFHSRAEILFSVLVLLVVALTARVTRFWRRPAFPWTLGLLVPLPVVAPDTQAYYLIPALPYLALMTAEGLIEGLPRLGRPVRVVVLGLLGLHVVNGAVHLGRIIATNGDTASRNAALAARIGHPGATVLAALPFVFNEIETYRIHGLTYYWIQTGFGRDPIPPEELLADARRRGVRFVIFSREDLKFSGWPEGTLEASGPGYRLLSRDDAHTILELP